MATNQTKYKKLRRKGEDIKRILSLNELHDLKNRHSLDASTLQLMAQKNLLKPKKVNSVQSRLKTKRSKKQACQTVYNK